MDNRVMTHSLGSVPVTAYGFQRPAAPSLVVSVATFSAKMVTEASGMRSKTRNAEVRPMTPPPTTAMFRAAVAEQQMDVVINRIGLHLNFLIKFGKFS